MTASSLGRVAGACWIACSMGSLAFGGTTVTMRALGDDLQVVAGSSSAAFCAGVFTIDVAANTATYYVVTSNLASGETIAAIHGPADPGQAGSHVHSMPLGPVKMGVWNFDEAQEADLLAGRFYIDIHSNAFPDGEVRGQICDMVCTIDGLQPNPSPGSAGRGFGIFSIDIANNLLSYHIEYTGLSSPEFVSHIHCPGNFGENDPLPPHTLPAGPLKVGSWSYPDEFEDDILEGRSYVLVHSTMFPGGEIRGQIIPSLSPLDASQEVQTPPVVSPGVGYALFAVNRAQNMLGFNVRYADLTGMQTVAHIHGPAAPGANGGIVVALPTGNPKIGAVALTPGNMADFDAGLLYVNIHSSTFTLGEVRGQILPPPPPPTPPGVQFIRGDCNGDAAYNIADAVSGLGVLFSGSGPESCTDACDANDDGQFNIADMISILGDLFSGDPLPPAPHPGCGLDPTLDGIDCAASSSCP
ncbi:MAG: CHRD domain-containing protein [Planctomycetota bacterium]